jgi:hypothetical protein
MNPQHITYLLYFYGTFLITCGIVSVTFIGSKAKTALISGGTSGIISLVTGHLVSIGIPGARLAGIMLTLALLIVFSWRSTKTLFKIFELIPSASSELKGKGIAFLIISFMAVVSIVVLMLQVISF